MSSGTSSNKKKLSDMNSDKGKPGKDREKADSTSKSSLGSTRQSSSTPSMSSGRTKSPATQSADGSMTAPGEKPTAHLPQASLEVSLEHLSKI